jgi:hypothetical protein
MGCDIVKPIPVSPELFLKADPEASIDSTF